MHRNIIEKVILRSSLFICYADIHLMLMSMKISERDDFALGLIRKSFTKICTNLSHMVITELPND